MTLAYDRVRARLRRAEEGLYQRLDRVSAPSRRRSAWATVMQGAPARRDHIVSHAYFALAARQWAGLSDDPAHVAPLEEVLEHCGPAPARVLDIGTGAGGSAALVARRFPEASVVAIDSSRYMLRLARRRHPLPNLEFRRASILRLPFPSNHFDLVVMLNAIPELGELRRVTSPGSRVVTASRTHELPPDGSPWLARWREAGFERRASSETDVGAWQLFVADGSRPRGAP